MNIIKLLLNIVLNVLHVLAHLILIILCKLGLLASTFQIKNSIEKLNDLSKFTKVGVEAILQIEMLTWYLIIYLYTVHTHTHTDVTLQFYKE